MMLNQSSRFKSLRATFLFGVLLVLSAHFASAATMRLYVGNLSYQTTEGELGDYFSSAGEVESVKITVDKDTGLSKGFAFVVMATREAGEMAIQMFNGSELAGRSITVNEARAR